VPVAGDQQQHRELVAEGRHPAFEHVAATVDHHARQVEHQSGAVVADGANRDQLLHGSSNSV